MVWDLLRTKKEKPAAGKTGYWRTFWRRRWDSNPRTLADQTISSRSRYDHFDTSPYLSQHQHLRKRGELMGRTKKNIQLKIPEKPRKIKGFRSGSYRIATTISSADPSATWVHLHIVRCSRLYNNCTFDIILNIFEFVIHYFSIIQFLSLIGLRFFLGLPVQHNRHPHCRRADY